MEIIAQYSSLFFLLALLLGLFMNWGTGANDVANAMGTSVGSGAISIRQAIVIAAVMEFVGALLAGGEVADTVSTGILNSTVFTKHPEQLVYGMLGALFAASLWLTVVTAKGWPVSTTHTIVGAIVGFAVAGVGLHAVQWGKMTEILASWFISPLAGGLLGLLLMLSIRKLILNTPDPVAQVRKWGPFYAFLVGWIVSSVTLFKGLKHVNIHLSDSEAGLLSILFGIVVAIIGKVMMNRIQIDTKADKDFHYASVEKLFVPMMVLTGCSMAFAHGANDVANGIGPMAAVISLLDSGGQIGVKSPVAPWMLFLGAVGIVFGLATYGFQVMLTIGHKITELTPTRGYASTLAAAATTVLASSLGLPVSTTHIAVGAVIGVGIARGIGAIDLRVVGGIVVSWLITVPIGAILSAFMFYLLKAIFS